MTDEPRYRLDDLRHFAASMGMALGIPPAPAAELASHLLWFDAAGLAGFGIATLPSWLERVEAREVDPTAGGKVTAERTGLVVLDGQGGLPPLILSRASGLAVEKARDAGLGLVRVSNLGPTGPPAPAAAEMAVGPFAAAILGPGPSWSWAFPSAEGLPAVFDSALAPEPARAPSRARRPAPAFSILPWIAALAPEGGWLVAAIAVAALEPLASFHERIGTAIGGGREAPGGLLPGPWEERRRLSRERGVPLGDAAMRALLGWGVRLGVGPPPAPVSPRTAP